MKPVLEQGLSMNLHLTQRSLKHSSNVECAENVRSSHVVECECQLCHIHSQYQMCAHYLPINPPINPHLRDAKDCTGNKVLHG